MALTKQEENKLRKYARNKVEAEFRKLKEDTEKKQEQLSILRSKIRNILLKEDSQSPGSQSSTGLNVLGDLLKKIIPVLETDYKLLTTSEQQRISYRAHVIRALVDSLLPDKIEFDSAQAADKINSSEEAPSSVISQENPTDQFPTEQSEFGRSPMQSDEIDMMIKEQEEIPGAKPEQPKVPEPNHEKYIPIEKPEVDTKKNKEQKDLESFTISGQDLTGRNMALKSWKKVAKTVKETYEMLSHPTDKRMFFDYLITNMKLYFDRFEAELNPDIEEPTTKEYEQTVSARDSYSPGSLQESKYKPKTYGFINNNKFDSYYKKCILESRVAAALTKNAK